MTFPKRPPLGYKQMMSTPCGWARLRGPFLTMLLLIVTGAFAALSADPDAGSAQAAARAWLQKIDAGAYSSSYADGSDAFRKKVSQDKWVNVLKTVRAPLGKSASRKLISSEYKPNGVNGLDGQCYLLSYATSYEKGGDYVETVVMNLEDGHWRGADFEARPKEVPL